MIDDSPLGQLAETAKFLPQETAELLLDMPVSTQIDVLSILRDLVVSWEKNGVHLDPVTLEIVLVPVLLWITNLSVQLSSALTELAMKDLP